MSLRIVTGRAGSGKTHFFLEEMRAASGAVYIVPEQFSFGAEKKLISYVGYSGMGGAQVLSFKRLAHAVSGRCGGPKGVHLSRQGQKMVLGGICRRLCGEMSVFAGSASRGEFAKKAAELISTFKQNAVTPKMLYDAASKAPDSFLGRKLLDLYKIYQAYDEYLAGRMFDGDDELDALAENIKKDKTLFGVRVYIDQFTTFTPQEYRVIASLLEVCESVSVALKIGDEAEFETVRETERRLCEIAKSVGVGIGKKVAFNGAMFASPDDIRRAEESIFAANPRPFDKECENVVIFRAKDPYSEIEYVARRILELVREKGYGFSQIALISRSLDAYEKEIARVFSRFEIPVFMDKKLPLSNHSAAAFTIAALSVLRSGYKNDDVIDFMKTSLSPLDDDESDMLENFCLECGVRSWDWKGGEKSVFKKNKYVDSERLTEADAARERLIAPIVFLETKIKSAKTARDFASTMYEFLNMCKVEEKINAIEETLAQTDPDMAARTDQVYALLLETLDNMCDAFGDEELSWEVLSDAFRDGLESLEIAVIPTTADSVCAGSVERVRGSGAKAVFIVGANDASFPAEITEDEIFADWEVEELRGDGIDLPIDKRKRARTEQLLMYDAVTAASEKLFISYSAADASGGGLRESLLAQRMKEAFYGIVIDEEDALEVMDYVSGAAATFENAIKEISRPDSPEIWRQVLGYYENDSFWSGRLAAARRGASYSGASTELSSQTAQMLYPGDINMSVTRLEKYRNCPFSYFSNYVLGLKKREELQLRPTDSGSLLHTFIEQFCAEVCHGGVSWDGLTREKIAVMTDSIFTELMGEKRIELMSANPRSAFLLGQLKTTMQSSAEALCRHITSGEYLPLGQEIEFREDRVFKPVTITLPTGKKLKIRGKIDRADICEADGKKYVRVIDYKSGGKEFLLNEVYRGLNVQMTVYLTALCEQGGYTPSGMLYFHLDAPIVKPESDISDEFYAAEFDKLYRMNGLIIGGEDQLRLMGEKTVATKAKSDGVSVSFATEDDFQRLSRRVKKIAREIAADISRGSFPVSPVKGGCEYCDYASVCDFDPKRRGCRCDMSDVIDKKDVFEKLREEESENG